jgi:uncharacterized protein YkwD
MSSVARIRGFFLVMAAIAAGVAEAPMRAEVNRMRSAETTVMLKYPAPVEEFEEILKAMGTQYATQIDRREGHSFDIAPWVDASQRLPLLVSAYVRGIELEKEPAAPRGSRRAIGDDKRAPSTTDALLSAHNRERRKVGRGPLVLSDKLSAAAAVHAKDMAAYQKLDHNGSDGSTVADRVKRRGYNYIDISENIANGQESVAEVMSTWMASPPHRDNVLGSFTEMGAALAEDATGAAYWCVDFGKPTPRLNPDEAATAVVKQINKGRQTRHRPRLNVDPKLSKAAMDYSAAMAAKDSLKLKEDPLKVLGGQGPSGRELLLKLGANMPTPDDVVRSVVGDDPKEIDSFEEIGVGYAMARSGTPYWCAIFSKPIVEKPRAVRLRERQDARANK